MRNLTKNLTMLWLAVTLVMTPLQAMTAGVADGTGAGSTPCAMNMAAGTDSRSVAHASHQVKQDSSAAHCRDCSDHTCKQGGECSSQGCAGSHVQPAAIAGIRLHQHSQPLPRSIIHKTFALSRTDPPLLRPPV